MIKNSILFIIVGILLTITHIFLVPLWMEQDAINEIFKQHLFLCLFSILIYISTYIATKKIPTQAGFVFIGLLLGKMAAAAFFVYGKGWLDENAGDSKKYIFFMFYVIYLIVLVVLTSKLLNKQADNNL